MLRARRDHPVVPHTQPHEGDQVEPEGLDARAGQRGGRQERVDPVPEQQLRPEGVADSR